MVILVVNWQFVQYNSWDGSGAKSILSYYEEYVSLGNGEFLEVKYYVNG